MSQVVVLVPSRSRPESLLKTWESIRDTSEASLLAYVDSDQADMYRDLPAQIVRLLRAGTQTLTQHRFTICIGPRSGPVHAINTLCHHARPGGCLREAFPEAWIWTYLTDDSTIGPPGWDRFLIDTIQGFPNRTGVVSLEHAGAEYVNYYALSTEMVEAVGYYAIPDANWAWFWDTAMELIGDASKIVYAQTHQVSVDHKHQVSTDSLELPAEDCARFARWCFTERKRILRSVRKRMEHG